jgi:hypothetical protein
VLKRAKYFITCNGKYQGDSLFDNIHIKNKLLNQNTPRGNINPDQLSFFDSFSYKEQKTNSGIILANENTIFNNSAFTANKELSNILLPQRINLIPDKITSITGEF